MYVYFFISCLNFCDEASFLSVRVFGRLSSFLLFFPQHFGCCILWPSAGVHCLSGHRNESTWEIISKVWLLIKQGVHEVGTSFIIIFNEVLNFASVSILYLHVSNCCSRNPYPLKIGRSADPYVNNPVRNDRIMLVIKNEILYTTTLLWG